MKKLIFTFLSVLSMVRLSMAQSADPSISLSITPSSIPVNTVAILSATVGNANMNTILDNTLRVTIAVGLNAEILGLAPGSDPKWTVIGSSTGAGNSYLLKNTGGGFGPTDMGIVLLQIKGSVVSAPDLILGNIVYISANNPALGGAPNTLQGNTSVANDNSQATLAVTAAGENCANGVDDDSDNAIDCADTDCASFCQSPVANDDVVATPLVQNGANGTVNILSNDTDSNGNPTAPSNGIGQFTVDLDPATAGIQTTLTNAAGIWTYSTITGVVTFDPANNYVGIATIPYQLCDPIGLCDNANISFTVSLNQNADPGISLMTNPGTVVLNSNTLLTASVGNLGNGLILASTLAVNITVGTNAEILGVASGSDSRWTVSSLTSGNGNSIALINSAGNFNAFDTGNILLNVKGTVISTPLVIIGGITYVAGNNPALGGFPNSAQGNGSTINDNSQTSLVVVAIPAENCSNGTDDDNDGAIDCADTDCSSVCQFPVANNDVSTTTLMQNGANGTINILTNDTALNAPISLPTNGAGQFSVDLDINTAGVQTAITNTTGVWSYNTSTGVVTFDPANNYFGTATLTYSLCSSMGQCDNATITFSVYAPQSADLYISIISNPGSVSLNNNSVVTCTVGNAGNDNILSNTLSVTIVVGSNAEVLGLAATSSPKWTIYSLTTGAGNTVTLRNTGGSFTSFNLSDIVLNVKGSVVACPGLILASIAYISGNNPALGGAPNSSQGNLSTTNDNSQTSLCVTAALENCFNGLDDDGDGLIDCADPNCSAANGCQAPIANDDISSTTLAVNGANGFINILTNDTDPNGNPTAPTNGTGQFKVDLNLSVGGTQTSFINATGVWTYTTSTGVVTFDPANNYSGTTSITYQLCDPTGLCDNAIIRFVVGNIPVAPIANDDAVSTLLVKDGFNGTVNILTNDTDPNGNPSAPTNGTGQFKVDLNLSLGGLQTSLTNTTGVWSYNNNNGIVTFNPANGYTGVATITYQLCDPTNLCDNATITFTVVPELNADPGISIIMTPASLPLNSTGILASTVGNFGNSTIVANTLVVRLKAGSNAQITGLAPGSDPRWTIALLTNGAGNIVTLRNTGGGFSPFDVGDILLRVKAKNVSGAQIITGSIGYANGSVAALGGALNTSQGNANISNNNSQTSLIVVPMVAELQPEVTEVDAVSDLEGCVVYPNPFSDNIFVQFEKVQENTTATLYNLEGKVMLTQKVNGETAFIQTQQLPSGLYFVKLSNGKSVTVRKIIKE